MKFKFHRVKVRYGLFIEYYIKQFLVLCRRHRNFEMHVEFDHFSLLPSFASSSAVFSVSLNYGNNLHLECTSVLVSLVYSSHIDISFTGWVRSLSFLY